MTALEGTSKLTQKLASNPDFREMEPNKRDKFIDHYFNDKVRKVAKEHNMSQKQIDRFKQEIKSEVGIWESAQGIEPAFNPITEAAIAGVTGGLSTLSRFGLKEALKTGGATAISAIPTSYIAGALSDPLYEESPALGLATDVGTGALLGMTTEPLMERTLIKGFNKVSSDIAGTYGNYGEKAANRVVKSPTIFEGEGSEVAKETQDLSKAETEIETEIEPGVGVRKDGKPYTSDLDVKRALKRKGMVETHEPVQLGENKWGFVAKTEKPAQPSTSEVATKLEQPESLKFQEVKEWQETSPGKFEQKTIDEVVPEETVAKELPLAHEFLKSQISGIKRKYTDAFTKTEFITGLRGAYNTIKPGIKSSERHLQVLSQMEDLGSVALKDSPRFDPNFVYGQIDAAIKNQSLDKKVGDSLKRFIGSLSENPDFNLQSAESAGSRFNALKNTVNIDSPTTFFHEVGHWSFYNVLNKNDRLSFAKQLMENYNSQAGWDSLIPARKKIRAGLDSLLKKGKISQSFRESAEKHFDQPLELYADMIGQHVWNNQVTAPEFSKMIDRTNVAMTHWLKSIRESGAEIPDGMQEFVNKVFEAPKAREFNPLRFEDNSQELANHMFFIPKDKVEAGIERDPEASFFLDRILNENLDIRKELESSNIDAEKVLDGLWAESMKWFHGVDVAYDSKDLTTLFNRMEQLYKPEQRGEVEKMFTKVLRTEKESAGTGHLGKAYNRYIDAMTGGEILPKTSSESASQAEHIQLEGHAERMAAQQFYDASRQVLNDVHGLFEGLKARKLDEFLPAKMPRQQAYNKIINDSESATRKINARETKENLSFVKRRWLDDSDMGATDAFNLPDKEHLKAAKASVFSRIAPTAISGMAGIDFDSEDGIPVPGTDVRIGFDPYKWATRGFSIGIPFTDLESPEIYPGPLCAAAAAGVTPRKAARGVKKVVSKMYDETGRMFPLVRRFVESQRQKARVLKKNGFIRSFMPNENLPSDLAKLSKQEKDEQMSILRKAERMSREINENFSREEQRTIADIIEKTGGEDLKNVGGDIVDQAEEVKKFHRQMRNLLEEAGYPKEAIDKMGDNYLHRIYSRYMRKHSGGSSKKRIAPEQLSSSWKKIFGDYINPRGWARTFKKGSPVFNDLNTATKGNIQEGDIVYDVGMGDERFYVHKSQKYLLNQFKDSEINHKWAVEFADTSSRNGKITLRRDWTKLERQELGEVKEVVPRIMEFTKMGSRDLALGNLFRKLSGTSHVLDPSTLSKEEIMNYENAGWSLLSSAEAIKNTGVKKYGSLAGKLVSPDSAFLLKGAANFRSSKLYHSAPFIAWRKLTMAWKLMKTGYDPGTHGRNFTSNVHMCLYDGKDPLSIFLKGAHHIKNKSSLFTQAIDEGMLDSQFLRSELGLDSFIQQMEKASSESKTESEIPFNMLKRYLNGAASAVKKGAEIPLRAYELGDEIFKMGYVADEVEKSKTVSEALELAQESFFDYRDIPRGIRTLRDSGLVPFISYQYKIFPKLAKVAADNPHRLLGPLLAYELINEMSYRSTYDGKAKATEKFHERLMPDWMKKNLYGAGPRGTVMLPGQTKGDKPIEFLDMSRSLPGGDLMSPNGLFGEYPYNFHPVGSTIYTLATERKPMFDKEYKINLEDLESATDDQIKTFLSERSKVLARTWLPNVPFYPGSWSTRNMGNAIVSEVKQHMEEGKLKQRILDVANKTGFSGVDYFGTPENLPEELVGFFGLANIRRLYPHEEYIRSLKKLKREISNKKSDLAGAAADPRTTESEMKNMKEGLKSLTDRNKKIIKQLQKLRRKSKKSKKH